MNNKVLDERSFNYFRVDNEFVDQQVKKCGWQGMIVYISLCRHANKKGTCYPSINYIARELGVDRKTIMKGIDLLAERKIITIKKTIRKDGGQSNNVYSLIDKRYWLADDIEDNPQSTTRTTPSVLEGLPLVPEKDSKNTNNNNTNNKEQAETSSAVSVEEITENLVEHSKEIQEIFKLFYEINPTINFGNKTQRKAAEEMIKKFGAEKTTKTVEFAISVQGKRYAPTITNPLELKNNMGKLLTYYKREQEPVKSSMPVFNL